LRARASVNCFAPSEDDSPSDSSLHYRKLEVGSEAHANEKSK